MPHQLSRCLAVAAAIAAAGCSAKGESSTAVAGSVIVEPSEAGLCIGDSVAFHAAVLDAAGDTIRDARVRWSSSAPEAVSIDSVSGVARADTFGAAVIAATSGGVRSASPAHLDVPQDLVAEFVPDTVVLAPGDTFTLGARLRSLSGLLAPTRRPEIAPFDSAIARLDTTGLVTAKSVGTQGLSVSACGSTGHGAARVFVPPDSATGAAYLWASGPAQIRLSLPARAFNFKLSDSGPTFQISSFVGTPLNPIRGFVYQDTVPLTGVGMFPVDSVRSDSLQTAKCRAPRPYAAYSDYTTTLLISIRGGATTVTSYGPKGSFTAVSGRMVARMRGVVSGASQLDTLQAIYTFSAPLKDTTGVCP